MSAECLVLNKLETTRLLTSEVVIEWSCQSTERFSLVCVHESRELNYCISLHNV